MTRDATDFDAVERSLAEFFAEVRAEEAAPRDLWERVASRMRSGDGPALDQPVGRAARGRFARRWTAAAALTAALALAALLVFIARGSETGVASAEEILQQAQATSASPQAAGIQSLVVTQQYVTYFLGKDQRDVPSAELESRVWYQAPDRQRVEFSYAALAPDGSTSSRGSVVRVWDGAEYWTYQPNEAAATVYRQDPGADIYLQGVLVGASPASALGDLYALSCRTTRLTEDDQVAGRDAHVVQLSRARCGLPFPGRDGRVTIWVDTETGLVLKVAQFAADGLLYSVREVTSIQINGAVDAERLRLTPPPDTQLTDRRDQPLGFGTFYPFDQPRSISLEEAREAATFAVQTPAFVPDGFTLESVEHYWGSEQARELRSHADWVLLRYADAQGNWLVITQGFGGSLIASRHLFSPPIPDAYTGTTEVNGVLAHWVEGTGTGAGQWEPGGMTSLGWQVGRPFMIGLASNVSTLDQLVTVAESLE